MDPDQDKHFVADVEPIWVQTVCKCYQQATHFVLGTLTYKIEINIQLEKKN